jgi:hypothetical protein
MQKRGWALGSPAQQGLAPLRQLQLGHTALDTEFGISQNVAVLFGYRIGAPNQLEWNR